MVRLRKGQVGRAWENLCMAMLGEQFMVNMNFILIEIKVLFSILTITKSFFFCKNAHNVYLKHY